MLPLLTGKIYPDKTFSIGFIPREKKKKREKLYDKEYEDQFDSYLIIERSYKGNEIREERFFDKAVIPDRFIKSSESSQIPKVYGSNGITGYGRKNVSGISCLLQQRFGRHRLGFATATLPPLTKFGSLIACASWGEIVRRFFQEIRRSVELKGKEFLYVSCTEIQEKRFGKTKIAYPHLQFVYVSRDGRQGDWYVSASEMRRIWERVVVKVVGRVGFPEGINESTFKASIDCQVVKRSASAYLGKYLSKGSKVVADMKKEGYKEFPRQWWSASMQCKRAFAKSVIRINSSLCSDIFYGLGEFLACGFITWFRFVEIPIAGEMKTVGIIGTVGNEAYDVMKNACSPW